MNLGTGKSRYREMRVPAALLLGIVVVLVTTLLAQQAGKRSVPRPSHGNIRKPDFDPRALMWGQPVENLQLGILVDEKTGLLGAWFRNAATNEITLCSYTWQGQDDYLLLQMRSDNELVSPRKLVSYMPDESGLGPRKEHLRNAPAGAVFGRFPPWGPIVGVPNRSQTIPYHSVPQAAARLGPTLRADLLAFDWPANTFTQRHVMIRLACEILRPKRCVIVSAPVVMDGRLLQELRAKGLAPSPVWKGLPPETHRLCSEWFASMIVASQQKDFPAELKP